MLFCSAAAFNFPMVFATFQLSFSAVADFVHENELLRKPVLLMYSGLAPLVQLGLVPLAKPGFVPLAKPGLTPLAEPSLAPMAKPSLALLVEPCLSLLAVLASPSSYWQRFKSFVVAFPRTTDLAESVQL